MKKLMYFIVVMFVLGISTVSADPRMEINDNFAHMILDPVNTDDEIFISGADSFIRADGAGNADGFFKKQMRLDRNKILRLFGEEKVIRFTDEDSATPCTMVESNGTEYESNNWISIIRIKHKWVDYELNCYDGVQQ